MEVCTWVNTQFIWTFRDGTLKLTIAFLKKQLITTKEGHQHMWTLIFDKVRTSSLKDRWNMGMLICFH